MDETPNSDAAAGLDEKTVERNPISQFRRWFQDAIASGSRLPESMTLATATKDGRPSARVVLLKQADEDGFVFYTNYRSTKAKELEANPQAALVFYWVGLDRQVRIEGTVTRASAQESDEYFETRPRESQIGSLASPQSEVIESREVLESNFRELDEAYRDRPVKRPSYWGGYRLK
ncbi:MAG: pyridoxamine 5'-phosphate oxidase, partial [Acidobacteria bacterium]|nr:pyridoxamine 5'-phosphate oxidase [Acidobacteriota bacterium]